MDVSRMSSEELHMLQGLINIRIKELSQLNRFLPEDKREELIWILAERGSDRMFGDSQNEEYVMYGVAMTGLVDMTDDELVREYADSVDEDDEFLDELRSFMVIHHEWLGGKL